ncbi:MAG: glycosyltransferase family 2 protein, partial [Pseudomonadota bacterium]
IYIGLEIQLKNYRSLTDFRKFQNSNTKTPPTVRQDSSGFASPNGKRTSNLPLELLVLNRYGIGYPYLKAAWGISRKYDIPASEVLIEAGILSEPLWQEAQSLLAREKAKSRTNFKARRVLLNGAINALRMTKPAYSAARTFTRPQLAFLCLGTLSFLCLGIASFNYFVFSFALFLTIFYTANILMRGMLLADYEKGIQKTGSLVEFDEANLPVYTVLVALYEETAQVRPLTQHLWNLNWPKAKLDIKLVCEADDLETVAAVKDEQLPDCFDLVLVPPSKPRTKPKALNYALPMAHGSFLVLYDAEDRPDPNQLREAYCRFVTSPPEVACLQAPLKIHNDSQSWLSRMFAIEYLTLFQGILPILARWQVPLPLGGTSNHFRTNVLRSVGAWDPFNVTEDADLGIRLFREGYRSETISSPTYEEAPSEWMPWLRQRTRWIKGWMQTILVHNRNPISFYRDVGLKNTIAFHLFLTSLVASVLIHPFFVAAFFYQLINLPFIMYDGIDTLIFGTSVFNLVGGYTTYGLLAYAVVSANGFRRFATSILTLPIYWFLISIAGWRAFVHLIVKPHIWEKTPHGLARAKFSLTVV